MQYQIIKNGITIGKFAEELDRNLAFEKYVEPNLRNEDSFVLRAEDEL